MLAVDWEWAVLKFRSTLNFFSSHRHTIHRQMIGLVGSGLCTCICLEMCTWVHARIMLKMLTMLTLVTTSTLAIKTQTQTQWTSTDAGVEHLSVSIYIHALYYKTTVTYIASFSWIGRKIILTSWCNRNLPKCASNMLKVFTSISGVNITGRERVFSCIIAKDVTLWGLCISIEYATSCNSMLPCAGGYIMSIINIWLLLPTNDCHPSCPPCLKTLALPCTCMLKINLYYVKAVLSVQVLCTSTKWRLLQSRKFLSCQLLEQFHSKMRKVSSCCIFLALLDSC